MRLEGDAKGVRIQANGRSYRLPASVPAGVYEVLADFGEGATVVGDVTVPTSGTVRVHCQRAMMVCDSGP